MKFIFSLAFVSILFFSPLHAKLCQEWESPKTIGNLDTKIINESSGIAVSHSLNNKFYHINDSGDGAYFYSTYQDGSETKKIKISKFQPIDVEDLSYGKCGEKNCIFIGDIGDNFHSRKTIQIIGVEEENTFSGPVVPVIDLSLRYPDGAYNAEAMALHPSGDLFIITKIQSSNEDSKIFKLSKNLLNDKLKNTKKLEFLGSLKLKKILKNNRKITGMGISPDGERFSILTYETAIEFNINLSSKIDWNSLVLKEGENFNLIKLDVLNQQEAITYSYDGLKLFYTTEASNGRKGAPIVEVACKK